MLSRGCACQAVLLVAASSLSPTASAQIDPEERLVARAGQHASPASGGGVQLTAGSDGSAVSLKFEGKLESSWYSTRPGADDRPSPHKQRARGYELTLSAPLSSGAKRGDVVGRDGLGADGAVSLSYKWLWTEPVVIDCPGLPAAQEKKAAHLRSEVEELLAWERDVEGAQQRLRTAPGEAPAALEALRQQLARPEGSTIELADRQRISALLAPDAVLLRTALQRLLAMQAERATELAEIRVQLQVRACSEQLMGTYKLTADTRYRHGANKPGLPATYYGGLTLAAGMKDSRFIDTTAVAEVKQRDEVGSVGLFIAGVPAGSGHWFWSLRADRKLAIEDQSEGVRCPGGAAGAQTCLTGPLGAPTRGYKTTLKAELRRLILAGDRRLAAAVSWERDFADGKNRWALPIYLVADAKGELIGGFEVGQKEGRPRTYALFVGVPFSLRP